MKEIMKGKKFKIFGVMMALAMVVSMASVGVASADPGSLKWTEIDMPEDGDEGDYTLWSESNVGPIAVSPDGGTIFAASGEDMDTLMRSSDGGSTWKLVMTKLDGEDATSFDGDVIVAIAVSPDYDDDDTVIVATDASVYISIDRGDEFTVTGDWDSPTSIALAADADGNLGAMLVGDGDDVYLKTGLIGSWTAQEVDASVLAVGFSTTYADDELIVAVVSDGDTKVRTKFGTSAWGATIPDAILYDTTGDDPETFDSESASIGIPDDFSATNPSMFVGVSADGVGDVYKITKDGNNWVATDLNVRDSGIYEDTLTDIWSISVSGDAADAVILVGTVELDVEVTPKQYLVYASSDGGVTFDAADKQPTGEEMATVVMGSAFVGTRGMESAFSAAADDAMTSWNQIGLIDVVIDEILDIVPTATFATNGLALVITYDDNTGESSLWETASWARIYSSTLTDIAGEQNACYFDIVRGAGATDIFVAEKGTTEMRLSSDSGLTFASRKVAKENITTLTVVDASKLYTGDENGNVWETVNGGTTWNKPTESEITGTVIQILPGQDGAILVGNDAGTVYICYDRAVAFEFERVGDDAAGTGNTLVAFDTNYIENNIIYAACTGTGAVYRFVIDESTTWKELFDELVVSGLTAATDGTLYVGDADAGFGVARSVNPTAVDPDFDWMDENLSAGATLAMLRVVPGGSNVLLAVDVTAVKIMTLIDTLTGKLSVLAPADDAVSGTILEGGATASVVLAWEGIAEADEYQYQVAIDEDFSSKAYDEDEVKGEVAMVTLSSGKTYYWRARVTEPLPSQWSETRSFNTPLGPGAARPRLESPEAGESAISLTPVLEWSGLVGSTAYELEVADGCDFGTLAIEQTVGTETIYKVTSDLDYSTVYCWRVKAISDTTESPWSDSGTFTTLSQSEADGGTPTWVWVVIAISAILLIAVIVLIVRTRRAT